MACRTASRVTKCYTVSVVALSRHVLSIFCLACPIELGSIKWLLLGMNANGIEASLAAPVMAFLLADSFQSSLDKLNGEEQKAAKLAAFELQINPANPRQHCHRLDNIEDQNFWLVRASRDIRLIFHRDESSLMLC